jgi:pyruvate, orthophosphate dikinase
MARWIKGFGDGEADPTEDARGLLGDKAAGLIELTALGLPVPPGFVLTTEACAWFFAHAQSWPEGLDDELDAAVATLERRTGKRFGDEADPLLVAVRSGAAASMPGMMDTVLDLGLNDTTVEALAARTGQPRFAWDSYRRFVQLFGDVVLGIHYTRFARARAEQFEDRDVASLSAEELRALVRRYQQVLAEAGQTFPQDPRVQLRAAIDAVFRSYNGHRARYYRKAHGIPDEAGTAVTVQAMVFGNLDDRSGSGVLFTRDPKTGGPGPFGEWLPRAQGDDVVSGTLDPLPLSGPSTDAGPSLEAAFPEIHEALLGIRDRLERHYRDLQDVEFTIESGDLWLLQTRTARRTAQASVRVVVDLVEEGLITQDEALRRIAPEALERLLRPVIAPDARRRVLASGLDASPGAASGRVVFHAADCEAFLDRGEATILVRNETSPEDIQGMTIAAGVLTARGGQTSHAAVVARGMGKPAVVGCTGISVDYSRQVFYAGDSVVRRGDWITIDGTTGQVLEGQVPMLEPETDSGSMARLLAWADARARVRVRANADNASDAERARQLGAVGIGLCRTEHMFFQPEALAAIRRMILADDPWARQRALTEILPMQRGMFRDLFRVMDGHPVTIRLLDPPLHEFLPSREEDVVDVAEELGVRVDALQARLAQLAETNPMLGHRGVRLGISTPQVYRTQARALFEAACEVSREGIRVHPEVLVPLVALPVELARVRDAVVEVAEEVLAEHGLRLDYEVGTMVELPRACLLAGQVAEHASFFSFGTNDLTQLVYGFSRDDMNKFLPTYQREGILTEDPLSTFDVEGVGQLVRLAAERGRAARPGLKLGICGEHGGDPTGVAFAHELGLDYVSTSPFRVPVARLAAAHAALAADEGA